MQNSSTQYSSWTRGALSGDDSLINHLALNTGVNTDLASEHRSGCGRRLGTGTSFSIAPTLLSVTSYNRASQSKGTRLRSPAYRKYQHGEVTTWRAAECQFRWHLLWSLTHSNRRHPVVIESNRCLDGGTVFTPSEESETSINLSEKNTWEVHEWGCPEFVDSTATSV